MAVGVHRTRVKEALMFRGIAVVVCLASSCLGQSIWSLKSNQSKPVGGWDLDQIYVFAGGMVFVDALHMTVFANNLWWLRRRNGPCRHRTGAPDPDR